MKKFVCGMMIMILLAFSVGCTEQEKKVEENAEKSDLIIFAAASMTESLEKIKPIFEQEHPNVNLVYTFDSSGTLKTQIEEGAQCDVFISAAQKQMDALEEEYIQEGTRSNILENKVVLSVPKENKKDIHTFQDIDSDKVESIALGNSDVPVGQYSQELLENLNMWDKIQDKITFGSNVKEVTTWVGEGVVDCGIIYKTDAVSADLEMVAEAEDSILDNKVLYPIGILKNSQYIDTAKDFVDFLKEEKAKAIFEEVGFTPVQ